MADFSLTVATHCTLDKIFYAVELTQRWQHRISLAVYLPDTADATTIEKLKHQLRTKYQLGERVQLNYLIGSYDDYPVNALRNLAIKHVRTSHVIMVDVDLWPSSSLSTVFQRLPRSLLSRDRVAVVLPSFEYKKFDCESSKECFEQFKDLVPHSVVELLACLQEGMCGAFYGVWAPETHFSTNLAAWLDHTQRNSSHYRIDCFSHIKYEPYVIVRKSAVLPDYDERFTGYGKNKIQFVQHLRYLEFEFYVASNAFLAHCPHRESKYKEIWSNESYGLRRNDLLFDSFLATLQQQHGSPGSTPMCA